MSILLSYFCIDFTKICNININKIRALVIKIFTFMLMARKWI